MSKTNNTVSNYTADQIETLDIMTHVRKRCGMYIGSNTIDGRHHITLEVISNGIDEYLNGYGNKMSVKLDDEGFITITDNGRGIPIGKHSSGKPVLQAVFDTANTGGKFNNSGEAGYNTSGGMNGIGAKATNATSERFEATTIRDGMREWVAFEKGKLVDYKIEQFPSKETGTIVK
ncbi:MAG: DNA topoisomerase IV subunit B, partial [Romboutsia sp.]|nr:DNA topoisomerase IV subunit B [Romboutsia sp.]